MSIILRCSSADSLFACAPSVLGGGLIEISVGGKAQAEAGTCIHQCLADYVQDDATDWRATFDRLGVPQDEDTVDLVTYGIKCYEEIKKYLPAPTVETEVESGELATAAGVVEIKGTIDILSPGASDNSAVFVDWKSGYIDDGYVHQMFAYAYCVWCVLGRPDDASITGIVAFLQHRYYRVVKYDAAKLLEWERQLVHNVLSKPELFKPGSQCRYCSRFADCEGRRKYVGSAIDAMFQPDGDSDYAEYLETAKELLAGLTPANKSAPEVGQVVNDLVSRLRLVEAECTRIKALVKDTVVRVGPIPTLNGFELRITEQQVKELIPARSIKLLREKVSDSQLAASMKLSLPKLLATYASLHNKGERVKAKQQLLKELEDIGAVSVSTRNILEEREIENVESTGSPNAQPSQPDTGGGDGDSE